MRRQIAFVLALVFFAYVPLMGSRLLFSLFALELGASAFEVGLIAACVQLPILLLSIPTALLTERFGARWLLFAGAVCTALGLLLPYLYPALPVLYAGSLLCGLGNVFSFQVTQALIGILSKPEELARNFSVTTFVGALTTLLGPLLAGYAIDYVGPVRSFLVLLPFALVYVVLCGGWGGVLPGGRGARERGPGLGETLADRRVWRLVAISSIAQMGVELYAYLLPVYGHGAGLPASTIGTIVSFTAVGSLCVPFFLTRLVRRLGEEPLLAWFMAGTAVSFIVVPFTASPALLLACSFLHGFSTFGSHPITSMMAFGRLPKERAAQFIGLRTTGNGALRVMAPPLFGALAALTGLPAVFALSALMMAAAGGWLGRGGRG